MIEIGYMKISQKNFTGEILSDKVQDRKKYSGNVQRNLGDCLDEGKKKN